MTIVELFNTIKSTSSTNAKKQLLDANMSDLVYDIFEHAYGEHKYYVTKLDRQYREDDLGKLTIEEGWADFKQVLWQCECHHISGNEARDAINSELDRFRLEDQNILYDVLRHNLKIGISKENFYDVIGQPVDKHEVSLAKNLKDVPNVDPLDGTYFASRKLDGVRCVCFIEKFEDGDVSEPIFKSRQNKEFTTLSNLIQPMKVLASHILIPGRYVFDGECCILDENGDEHFDWIMKEITRKNHTIANPCYNIFDFVPEEVFYGRAASNIFSVRLQYLKDIYNMYCMDDDPLAGQCLMDRIHLLYQERITCQEDFDRWSGYVKEGNWEGFMLRKDVQYKGGRSKDLLKVKLFLDSEYTILDTINGTVTYNEDGQKEYDACVALIIEHKGNQVKVGSGLSKEQRIRWYDHPEEIVGKTATIQFFEETKDSKTGKYSLRFPVLKYVYDGNREV